MSHKVIDIETKYRKEFDELFSQSKSSFAQLERGYAMPKCIETGAILFIGLNPSLDLKREHEEWYSLNQDAGGYYAKFQPIAGENHRWTHIDLLAIREGTQNEIKKLEKDHTPFIYENLQLSKEIIEISKPKAIVVVNTLARKYLGKDIAQKIKKGKTEHYNTWLGYDFGKMQEDGTYHIQNKDSNLQGVPVFFSGMLTGRHTLDNGSYDRLKWHVQQILK